MLGVQLAANPVTAKQVVANSLKARGGAAAFAAVHSFHFKGHLELGDSNAPLEVWGADRPARIRVEVTLPNGKLTQGYDGTTAWEIDPGQTAARVLSGAEANHVKDQALGFLDLLSAPGNTVEMLGQGTLDGHAYDKLGITVGATGDGFVQYVDTTTWLAFHEEYPGGIEEIGDYRKVGGLLLPFHYVSGPPGEKGTPLVRETMELDPAVPAGEFKAPGRSATARGTG